MCICVFKHHRDGRHKRDLSSHPLTLGSVRPTRCPVYFMGFFLFWRGGVEGQNRVRAPPPFILLCPTRLAPPFSSFFVAVSRSIKTEEEPLFVLVNTG